MKPLALVALFALAGPAAAEAPRTFGKPLAARVPVALADVLAKPENGRLVRLEGTIEKVCQHEGCWLTLKQEERSVHVTFEGYGFVVPKDVQGRPVALDGKVIVKDPTPEEVAHLQAEGGGAPAAARVSIEATGVEVR
jgi:hypothetical protein